MRFAYLMALPTDDDLFELGVSHAGEYLERLEAFPEEEERFKQERTRDLGQTLDQPIGQKVRHFCEWLLYRVRGGEPTSGDGKPQAIDKKQAERFQRGMIARVRRTPAAEAAGGRLSPNSPGSPGSPKAGAPGGGVPLASP